MSSLRRAVFVIGFVSATPVIWAQHNPIPGNPVTISGRLGVGTVTPIPSVQAEIVGPGGPVLGLEAPSWPGFFVRRGSTVVFQLFERSDYTDHSVQLGTPTGTPGWLYFMTNGIQQVGISPTGGLRLQRGGITFSDGSTQYTATAEGPPGPRGERGLQGERGLPGLKGDKGDPGGITSLNGATGVVTLVAGANLQLTRSGNTIVLSAPIQGCRCQWTCCKDSSCNISVAGGSGKADNIQQCQQTARGGCTWGYSSLSCPAY